MYFQAALEKQMETHRDAHQKQIASLRDEIESQQTQINQLIQFLLFPTSGLRSLIFVFPLRLQRRLQVLQTPARPVSPGPPRHILLYGRGHRGTGTDWNGIAS